MRYNPVRSHGRPAISTKGYYMKQKLNYKDRVQKTNRLRPASIGIIIAILFLWMSPALSFAYTETTDGGEMLAVVDPASPGSFSNVDISVKSFSMDLDRSQIAWSVDGKEIGRELGLKKISLKTGAVGKIVTIIISATDQNGDNITKTIGINPADVDLLWESDSYVPNFYKGASLPSEGSKLRVYALPNLRNESGRISPTAMVYKWRLNYQDVKSGSAKNALDVTLSGSTQNKISVEVSDLSGEIRATRSLAIGSTPPVNIFYTVDSLFGTIYDTAVSGVFNMGAKEVVIKAEPFYMTNKGDKSFFWRVNNEPFIPEGGDIGTITLRQGTTAGDSSLGVTINNQDGQSVSGSLRVKFGQNIFNF